MSAPPPLLSSLREEDIAERLQDYHATVQVNPSLGTLDFQLNPAVLLTDPSKLPELFDVFIAELDARLKMQVPEGEKEEMKQRLQSLRLPLWSEASMQSGCALFGAQRGSDDSDSVIAGHVIWMSPLDGINTINNQVLAGKMIEPFFPSAKMTCLSAELLRERRTNYNAVVEANPALGKVSIEVNREVMEGVAASNLVKACLLCEKSVAKQLGGMAPTLQEDMRQHLQQEPSMSDQEEEALSLIGSSPLWFELQYEANGNRVRAIWGAKPDGEGQFNVGYSIAKSCCDDVALMDWLLCQSAVSDQDLE